MARRGIGMNARPNTSSADERRRRDRRRRGPRRATPDSLRAAALHYLERYESSAAHLRRLLLARVERSARTHGTEREEGAAAVDALIAEFLSNGSLDDARYARMRALSLHRRGASARAIRRALAAKGVAREVVTGAIECLEEASAEPELTAALNYVRRRRLGPCRAPHARAEMRDRDLAALGRQGFSYDLARRVIDAEDLAELEAEAGAPPGRVAP